MSQPEWQLRVIEEKRELDEKLEKLRAFFETEPFNTLIGDDQMLLQEQARYMDTYSAVLHSRISRFGG